MDIFELICLLTLIADILLFCAVFYLYKKLSFISSEKIDLLIKNIDETKKLTEDLQKIVEEKSKITKEVQECLRVNHVNKNNIKENKNKVIQLHKKGLSIQEISNNTGLTQGEVELILSIATQINK